MHAGRSVCLLFLFAFHCGSANRVRTVCAYMLWVFAIPLVPAIFARAWIGLRWENCACLFAYLVEPASINAQEKQDETQFLAHFIQQWARSSTLGCYSTTTQPRYDHFSGPVILWLMGLLEAIMSSLSHLNRYWIYVHVPFNGPWVSDPISWLY